jgi:hypothetical protein
MTLEKPEVWRNGDSGKMTLHRVCHARRNGYRPLKYFSEKFFFVLRCLRQALQSTASLLFPDL